MRCLNIVFLYQIPFRFRYSTYIDKISFDLSGEWLISSQMVENLLLVRGGRPCVLLTNSFHLVSLQWRHNERDGVSNHQPHECLINRLFQAQIKENIKAPRHWPLWREFTGDRWIPDTKASNAENVPFHDVIMCKPRIASVSIAASLGFQSKRSCMSVTIFPCWIWCKWKLTIFPKYFTLSILSYM